MTLLTSLKDYAKRHCRGLMVTATIAGGSYLAGKYATNKLKEYQENQPTNALPKKTSWAQLQESRKQEKLLEKRKQDRAARKIQRREEKATARLEAAAAAAAADQQQQQECNRT
ncbi:unnamed protein product [Absidia cylindrospora]